ncbi:MAG: FAD-dependent oxidoreductase [Myxococcota bacterium]|nr:FAD-dependent oxidoreductase [Myxococcota bacterium]
MSTIVVVGASLAGGRCVEQLRRRGFEGRIQLVGAEAPRPYDRPPLSKKYLRRQMDEEKLYLRPLDFYAEKDVELVLGANATGLSCAAREVTLEDGRALAWDQLVIATGANVRRLRVPGAELEGVHYLRSLEDARGLREELSGGRRAVVIGAGVIGAEVAAACREEGVEVVMLEQAELPLLRAFGPEIGRLYDAVHRDHGVDLRCGVTATALRGQGRVEAVETSDGQRVDCDLVVVGIGVEPAVAWLEGSDVDVDGGVLVDDRCRTSAEGVFAAGDVTRWWSEAHGRHMCVESVDNAQTMASHIAENALGGDSVYAPVPFFWSDQYDLKLQIVGHVGAYDQVVIRGSLEDRKLTAFHLREGRLAFAVGVNRLNEMGISRKLISSGAVLDPALLADEDVKGKALLPD